MEILKIHFDKRESVINITNQVMEFAKKSRLKTGFLILQVPERTTGISILDFKKVKGADTAKDFLKRWDHIMPLYDGMQYTGPLTPILKSSTLGKNISLPVENGTPILANGQGIIAADFDGPGDRQIFIGAYGEQLQKNEQISIPKFLSDYNKQLAEKDQKEKEDQIRMQEEMRQEYRKEHPEMFEDNILDRLEYGSKGKDQKPKKEIPKWLKNKNI